ncbi:MAG TPA: bacillithiol biosynthesis BshC, partial [Blastocatellia bacterium]|nr:bacillithiol biosynthesis BshC [Blastocatellia bacterium]
MTSDAISFSDIPRTSKLYRDFLYEFQRVERFYESEGRDLESLVNRARRVAEQRFAREAVADVLLDQNRAAHAGEATLANLERLREPNSVVVITGQQAGLFTGPLYTIYKALTVIKLSAALRERGVNAVPMFWVASEDHDLEEVNHTRLVNREGQLTTITYTGAPTHEGKPVGHVKLGTEIERNIEELVAALPESEFIPKLVEDLRGSYRPGASFAEAFGEMM